MPAQTALFRRRQSRTAQQSAGADGTAQGHRAGLHRAITPPVPTWFK
ncbi:MAG: hypothetical protein KME26_06095 [Oscillatoria princeps RMCB-10]|nr:hypothetical protein [Oscillatoria princeps RMCB-10]